MSKLNVGILGFRNIAQNRHAKMVLNHPQTELVAAADIDAARRRDARDKFGVPQVYGNYMELLAHAETDIIVVALPVPLHYPATMEALKRGNHVLCEKPPANNALETKRMVERAEEKGLVLSWGLQRRFTPMMSAAHDAIQKDRLGTIYRAHAWYTLARQPLLNHDRFRMLKKGGGVFMDIGIHATDMAWWLMGCPRPTRVVASNHTVFPEWNAVKRRTDMAEDNSFAMIFFENGASLCVEACYLSQRENPTNHRVQLRLLGDKGGLHIPSLILTSGGKNAVKSTELKIRKSWRRPRALFDQFINAVLGKDDPIITGRQGIDLMKMVDAVIKSADQQREIRIR